jgi:membrane protease YdiL (CAAX protease family)
MLFVVKSLLYIYWPVLLFFFISGLRDRFEHDNNLFRSHNWSLMSTIVIFSLFLSGNVMKSLWSRIPILKTYEYNPLSWDIVTLFWSLLILFLVYLLLQYVYHIAIIEVFNIKLSQLPFILRVCTVLTVLNILSIYLVDFNLLLNIRGADLEILKSMDVKTFIIDFFSTVIMAPIVEESVFRGLIYSPLYKKVGRSLALILTSLFWTTGHFLPLLPSIGVFITGLILGWLYDRSGSLIHPIVFHMFKNSWILIYYFK